jgi:curved DNA-binding protein CbpA
MFKRGAGHPPLLIFITGRNYSMSPQDDYYQVVGVETTATQQEIKIAYRKLALQYHPDRNRDNPAAADIMKKLNEAYAVLSDPTKRQHYDALRQQYGPSAYDRFHQSYTEQDIFRGSDIDQIFEELARAFGLSNPAQVFSQMYGSGYQSFEFRRSGFSARGFVYTSPFGWGAQHKETHQAPMPAQSFLGGVMGKTVKYFLKKMLGLELPERGRDWSGVITLSPQQARRGGETPYVHRRRSERLAVKFPPGIRDGQRIRLHGMGAQGKGGGEAGDLYLTVRVRKSIAGKIRNALRNIIK